MTVDTKVLWLRESLAYIIPKVAEVWDTNQLPDLGIVCGSGLHSLSSALDSIDLKIPFNDIPNLSPSSVAGHPGIILFGKIAGLHVILLQGRIHYYEGHSPYKASFPVLILTALGVSTLVLSNAAGGLAPNYRVGDIMLITDHIYLAGISGLSPLVGPHISIPDLLSLLTCFPHHHQQLQERMKDRRSERFTSLNGIYSAELQKLFGQAILDTGCIDKEKIHCGVYAYTAGPQYESPAETVALRNMGADAVGMSTVSESLIAAQFGVRLLAFSLISNEVPVHSPQKSSNWLFSEITNVKPGIIGPCHQEVVDAGKKSSHALVTIMKRFCELYAKYY